MIDAGLPLVQASRSSPPRPTTASSARVLMDVKIRVESGSTFADALAEHPKVFDELFVQLVARRRDRRHPRHHPAAARRLHREEREAEAAGQGRHGLPGHRAHRGGRRDRSCCSCFVTPDLREDVQGLRRRACPAPTQFLIDLSHGFTQLLVPDLRDPGRRSSSAFRPGSRTASGRRSWDAFVLKVPVFGPLIRKVAVARFTRTLGTMLSSGVPILDALEIVAKTAGNRIIETRHPLRARQDLRGQEHRRPAGRDQGLPAHGGADDRRRRGRPAPWTRCSARSPTSTTTRSTWRSARSPA